MTIVIQQTLPTSAIQSYSELCTTVADWIHRTDLGNIIPTFVAAAEESMSADINSRSMDSKTTLYTSANTSAVALPIDMVEMRRLQVVGSYNNVLKYVTPDQLGQDYSNNITSRPSEFTVIGGNIELAPTPDSIYALELTYKRRIPALSNTNTTNWVLQSWPSVYLYGTLIHACNYTMDFERQAVAQKMYDEAVSNINKVDWYSGATMTVRAR